MNKTQLKVLMTDTINASKNDKKATKAQLIGTIETIMAEYMSSNRSNVVDANPPILNDKGEIIEVYCLKHCAYETVGDFAIVKTSKTGYHNKCKIADYQWKDFLAKIKVVDVDLSQALEGEDYELAKALNESKKSLILSKDSSYDYPTEDEIVRISPTVK